MLLTLSGRCGTSVGCGQRIIGRGQGRGKMIPCACAIIVSDNTPIKAVTTCPIFIISSSFRQDCQDCPFFDGLEPGTQAEIMPSDQNESYNPHLRTRMRFAGCRKTSIMFPDIARISSPNI